MTREAAKILEMVQNGSISPEEGQRLLEALDKQPNRIAHALSPYSLFVGDRGLAAVAVTLCIAAALAHAGVVFAGVFQLTHIEKPTVALSALAPLNVWLWLAGCWALALRLTKTKAFVGEVLSYAAIALVPMVTVAVATLVLLPEGLVRGQPPTFGPALLLLAFIGILGLAGSITWMINGFRELRGKSGASTTALALASCAIADIGSRLTFYFLLTSI